MSKAELDMLTHRILQCAFAVHTALGPGLLEGTYQACMLYELKKQGLEARAEVALPVIYDSQKLVEVGYRIDILVENAVILERKSIEAIAPVHRAQLLSYLRLSKLRVGLLINFNVERLKDGIVRQVNSF